MGRTWWRVVVRAIHWIPNTLGISGRETMGMDWRGCWGEGEVRLESSGIEDRVIVHTVIIKIER